MLRNCTDGKMSSTAISSTTNQWPQNQILDGQKTSSFMPSSSTVPSIATTNKAIMEKSIQDPAQNPLKCPRCDSSNTKFCYYNNYSLSQPRHFCKACKRYWTRGGTLRNVPVGGGCRKNNKRVKRPPPGGSDGLPAAVKPFDADLSPAPNHASNPMFYSLPTNSLEPNFPFSRLISTARVSSDGAGFDNQHQVRLGFSSSGLMAGELHNTDYINSVCGSKHNFQDDVVATYSNSLVSAAENRPILFGSPSSAPALTMASLLAASGLHHQQRFSKDVRTFGDRFPGLLPCEDSMQMSGGDGELMFGKEVIKMENGFGWDPNRNEQMNSFEPSSILWNTTNYAGSWFDPSNILQGSSVHSLI